MGKYSRVDFSELHAFKELTVFDISLLNTLRGLSNKKGYSYMSKPKLAKLYKVSKNTILSSLRRLEKRGLVSKLGGSKIEPVQNMNSADIERGGFRC